MGKNNKRKALVIHRGGQTEAHDITKEGAPIRMEQEYLRAECPDIRRYTEAHKQKILEKELGKMDVREISKMYSLIP